MDAWRGMSAAELGRGIGAGEIDPVALTETFLAAIDAPPRGAAHLCPHHAATARGPRRGRRASGRGRARRRSPLDGVPMSWKDLFDTAGVATEAGSRAAEGPGARARRRGAGAARRPAGLVCLGKTHMTELAFSGLGLNPVTATPPNVNDPDAVPGGSSSGAAASVAFGLAAAAHRARTPAGRCGCRRPGTTSWG